MALSLLQLKNSYRDRTLLVVSCGPSARHWEDVLSTLPGDTVIACVKQGIFLCNGKASLHFFNTFNCQKYSPYNRNALKIFIDERDTPVCFNSSDIVFSLDERTFDITKSVAYTGKFEEHTIDKTGLIRCWGPGIMYDAVIYTSIFLGFRNIHTIGWDTIVEPERAEENEPIEYFYDSEERLLESATHEWLKANRKVYKLKAYIRHLRGQMYNRLPKTDTLAEAQTIRRSLPRLFEWLQSEEVSLTIHTRLNQKFINETIRRHVIGIPLGVEAKTAPGNSASVCRLPR